MSIRIDTGFVFPQDKLSEFQERAYARITGELTKSMRGLVETARDTIKDRRELTQVYGGFERSYKDNCECGYHFFLSESHFFEKNGLVYYAYYWGGPVGEYTGEDLDYVRACPYWNNRDKSDKYPESIWNIYGELWSELLSKEGNPSPWNRKLSWQVIDSFEIHKIMMSLVRNGQREESNNAQDAL